MSYKTVNYKTFPNVVKQDASSRLKQEFTAIQVHDPYTEQLPSTPPQEVRVHSQRAVQGPSPREGTPIIVTTGGNNAVTNAKMDDLANRQDQLLNQQVQLSHRQNEIADHLRDQNNALNASFLKQVLGNKDNIIAQLARLQQSDWDEHTRELLSQHIRFIVAIVQRLNLDIEGLEAELRGRDIAVVGTNKAVNKLEVHHVNMLQDLRGRIVRCDTSIAKHSKDLVLLMDEIRRLEALVYGLREKLVGDIHRLEAEIISMSGVLDRQAGEQRNEMKHLRSDLLHRLAMMDDRHKANMAELREALDGNKANIDHYLARMEAKFKAMIDKATAGWGDLMLNQDIRKDIKKQVDRQIEKNLVSILHRLAKLEEQMAIERNRLKQLQTNIDGQVVAIIEDNLAYHQAELAKAKHEFRKGFNELQESLANMKHVVEGRRKLMGDKMSREIGAVKKALFMEMPQAPAQEGNTYIIRNVDKSNEW